jgi:hypothetical protein
MLLAPVPLIVTVAEPTVARVCRWRARVRGIFSFTLMVHDLPHVKRPLRPLRRRLERRTLPGKVATSFSAGIVVAAVVVVVLVVGVLVVPVPEVDPPPEPVPPPPPPPPPPETTGAATFSVTAAGADCTLPSLAA